MNAIRLQGMISGDSGGTLMVSGKMLAAQEIFLTIAVERGEIYGVPEWGGSFRELVFDQQGEELEEAFSQGVRDALARTPSDLQIELLDITFEYKDVHVQANITFMLPQTNEVGKLQYTL